MATPTDVDPATILRGIGILEQAVDLKEAGTLAKYETSRDGRLHLRKRMQSDAAQPKVFQSLLFDTFRTSIKGLLGVYDEQKKASAASIAASIAASVRPHRTPVDSLHGGGDPSKFGEPSDHSASDTALLARDTFGELPQGAQAAPQVSPHPGIAPTPVSLARSRIPSSPLGFNPAMLDSSEMYYEGGIETKRISRSAPRAGADPHACSPPGQAHLLARALELRRMSQSVIAAQNAFICMSCVSRVVDLVDAAEGTKFGIGFIGCGGVARATISLLARCGVALGRIHCMVPVVESPGLQGLKDSGVQFSREPARVFRRCRVVFLCFPPLAVPEVATALKGSIRRKVMIVSNLATYSAEAIAQQLFRDSPGGSAARLGGHIEAIQRAQRQQRRAEAEASSASRSAAGGRRGPGALRPSTARARSSSTASQAEQGARRAPPPMTTQRGGDSKVQHRKKEGRPVALPPAVDATGIVGPARLGDERSTGDGSGSSRPKRQARRSIAAMPGRSAGLLGISREEREVMAGAKYAQSGDIADPRRLGAGGQGLTPLQTGSVVNEAAQRSGGYFGESSAAGIGHRAPNSMMMEVLKHQPRELQGRPIIVTRSDLPSALLKGLAKRVLARRKQAAAGIGEGASSGSQHEIKLASPASSSVLSPSSFSIGRAGAQAGAHSMARQAGAHTRGAVPALALSNQASRDAGKYTKGTHPSRSTEETKAAPETARHEASAPAPYEQALDAEDTRAKESAEAKLSRLLASGSPAWSVVPIYHDAPLAWQVGVLQLCAGVGSALRLRDEVVRFGIACGLAPSVAQYAARVALCGRQMALLT